MSSRDGDTSTSLKLLADDGIVHVSFRGLLTAEQYTELMKATSETPDVRALESALHSLGSRWGIETFTRIVSQKRPQ